MKQAICHCCKKPATDCDGNPKKEPICWECIRQGGSRDRTCAIHCRIKDAKSKWTSKPRKKGWYWIRVKGAQEICGAGFIHTLCGFRYCDAEFTRRQVKDMWNFEFHSVTPPK